MTMGVFCQDKVIRFLVAANILFIVISVALSAFLESSLPQPLQEYLDVESEKEILFLEVLLLFIGLILFVLHFIALIGVYLYKMWSRTLLVSTTIGLFVLLPFLGPFVEHAIPATLDGFSSVLLGALISLTYFGESSFNKFKNVQPPTGGTDAASTRRRF